MPFCSWQCLTLILSHRAVDLVIRNDKDMEKILKFLICNLKTVDGNRDSGVQLVAALNKQSITKRTTIKERILIEKQNAAIVWQKVYRKYLVMKFRAKVSFMAFLNGVTITELILKAIIKTYS